MGSRRNPFRGVMDTMSEMARMREYAEGSVREEGRRTHATAWVPNTDIFAIGDDLKIRCELSGMGPEDVEISLYDGALTVEGERTGAPETTDFYARERHYGHFRRRLKLPQDVEKDRINASFQNGLLEITVKGAVDGQGPEHIPIEHASSEATSIRAR